MAHPTRKLQTPEELLDLWNEFKEWKKNQTRPVPTLNPKSGEIVYMLHLPPITLDAFMVWTVNKKGWGVGSMDNYIENPNGVYDDFRGVVSHMRREAKTDRLDGAAVGQFKEGLISRFDGYSDRQEIEHKQEPRVFNVD